MTVDHYKKKVYLTFANGLLPSHASSIWIHQRI